MGNNSLLCQMCDKPVFGRPFVLLNRIVVHSGKAGAHLNGTDPDGDYSWEPGETQSFVSGPAFCFPACLQSYIEGQMITADIAFGHTR